MGFSGPQGTGLEREGRQQRVRVWGCSFYPLRCCDPDRHGSRVSQWQKSLKMITKLPRDTVFTGAPGALRGVGRDGEGKSWFVGWRGRGRTLALYLALLTGPCSSSQLSLCQTCGIPFLRRAAGGLLPGQGPPGRMARLSLLCLNASPVGPEEHSTPEWKLRQGPRHHIQQS